MPQGFFLPSVIASSHSPEVTVAQCGVCGLYKGCTSPKMPVTGEGRKKTLVVAEAPGREEDAKGVQLIGPAGKLLRKYLNKIDVDLDKDCWKTNSLICRPPSNRTPTSKEIEYCRPNLLNTIKELEPERIILLGGAAFNSLIGHLVKKDVGAVNRWVGWKIPCQTNNAWICPTYHPSYLLREKNEILDLWFAKHLEDAFKLEGRPWEKVPDYKSQVNIILDTRTAARKINYMDDYMRDYIGVAAFDYETTMLKPDSKDSQTVCCSIAWGNNSGLVQCIAFPLDDISKPALSRFIKSPIGKIASNMKFEDRWTKRMLGHGVRNWRWDTMQAAHVVDNRRGITSVKFQAFVLLGFPTYDERIAPYLKASSATTVNKILTDVDMGQLLLYCGLDSLLELEVAFKQTEMMGISL